MAFLPALMASRHVTAQNAPAVPPSSLAPAWGLPIWTAQGRASKDLTSRELLGQWVYLDFWASWCGPCKQSFPWMSDMQTRYAPRGLQIVAINVDVKPADAAAFLRASAPAFAVAFDQAGLMPKAYGVKAMPSSYLVAPDGKVLRLHSGFRESDRAELEAAIVQALPVRE